jgi:hypothetical protein
VALKADGLEAAVPVDGAERALLAAALGVAAIGRVEAIVVFVAGQERLAAPRVAEVVALPRVLTVGVPRALGRLAKPVDAELAEAHDLDEALLLAPTVVGAGLEEAAAVASAGAGRATRFGVANLAVAAVVVGGAAFARCAGAVVADARAAVSVAAAPTPLAGAVDADATVGVAVDAALAIHLAGRRTGVRHHGLLADALDAYKPEGAGAVGAAIAEARHRSATRRGEEAEQADGDEGDDGRDAHQRPPRSCT